MADNQVNEDEETIWSGRPSTLFKIKWLLEIILISWAMLFIPFLAGEIILKSNELLNIVPYQIILNVLLIFWFFGLKKYGWGTIYLVTNKKIYWRYGKTNISIQLSEIERFKVKKERFTNIKGMNIGIIYFYVKHNNKSNQFRFDYIEQIDDLVKILNKLLSVVN
jgi:hypothetical protein